MVAEYASQAQKKLIDMNKAKRTITLCYRCRDNYETAGYRLIFVGNAIKTECDICAVRMGFDYYLEDRRNANKTV